MNNGIKRVTRDDVAKEAKVSNTIVSYVVNNNRYVDKDKKDRVMAAIKKLGYRPNSIARALKGKKTNHIIFIVDDIHSEHFINIVETVDSLAYENGYIITLCQDKEDEDFINRILDGYYDGIVIASNMATRESIQKLINLNIPLVYFEIRDYGEFSGSYGKINTGLYQGGIKSIEALYNNNRRNIVYAGASVNKEGLISKEGFRYKAFVDKMNEYNIPINDDSFLPEGGEEAIKKAILNYRQMPDAFFCRTDSTAFLIMKILKELNVNVPKDVSVVGYNDSSWCELSTPKLSSVKIDRLTASQKVLEFLENLSNSSENFSITLNTQLILRDTI